MRLPWRSREVVAARESPKFDSPERVERRCSAGHVWYEYVGGYATMRDDLLDFLAAVERQAHFMQEPPGGPTPPRRCPICLGIVVGALMDSYGVGKVIS